MAGLSSRLIVQVLIVGVPLLAIFLWYVQTPGQVLLEPHQVARIMSFLHPENYADSTALQTNIECRRKTWLFQDQKQRDPTDYSKFS